MDEILFPTSPLVLQAATSSRIFASFSAPTSPTSNDNDNPAASPCPFLSPFLTLQERSPEDLSACTTRLEAK